MKNTSQVPKRVKKTGKKDANPLIGALKESGLSVRLLADHSGLPYVRIRRLMKYGFVPRPEEVAALHDAVKELFQSILTTAN